MNKLFPAQLTTYTTEKVFVNLQTINLSYHTWLLNVDCYSWQWDFQLTAVTAKFFETAATGKIFGLAS